MSEELDEEHFKRLLREGRKDLSKTILTEANLDDCVLSDVDLSDSDLGDSLVRNARFERVDLTEIYFGNIDARGTNFRRCVFGRATLSDSNFGGSTFVDCVFGETMMTDCVLRRSRLERVRIHDTPMARSILTEASVVGAYLQRCGLTDLQAERSEFRDCQLVESNLVASNFSGASFRGTKFVRVQVADCNFANAEFAAADMSGSTWFVEDYEFSVFTGATFDSRTQFPPDFDPDALGMRQLADE